MGKYAIITAGGIGKRMKSEIPKQFVKLESLPVLMHTIKRFYDFESDLNIILSLPENYILYWENLCKEYNFEVKHKIVKGGETRFRSIKNALDTIEKDGIVAVHDGVRPLVNRRTIERTFEIAEKKGNAVASFDIVFSLRKISDSGNTAVNRDLFKEIQTPQTFRVKELQNAYNVKFDESFTDDASVFEAAGYTINLVEGNRENIKITTEEDLIIAETLLNRIL